VGGENVRKYVNDDHLPERKKSETGAEEIGWSKLRPPKKMITGGGKMDPRGTKSENFTGPRNARGGKRAFCKSCWGASVTRKRGKVKLQTRIKANPQRPVLLANTRGVPRYDKKKKKRSKPPRGSSTKNRGHIGGGARHQEGEGTKSDKKRDERPRVFFVQLGRRRDALEGSSNGWKI